jgi:hypothetical protein
MFTKAEHWTLPWTSSIHLTPYLPTIHLHVFFPSTPTLSHTVSFSHLSPVPIHPLFPLDLTIPVTLGTPYFAVFSILLLLPVLYMLDMVWVKTAKICRMATLCLRDFRLSQQCCRVFRTSGMWQRATGWASPAVSRDGSALNRKVNHSKSDILNYLTLKMPALCNRSLCHSWLLSDHGLTLQPA